MISKIIDEIKSIDLNPLDFFPQPDLREKIVDLILRGIPHGAPAQARRSLAALRNRLLDSNVDQVKVVVFGGGTGLSNIIGGDSRQQSWVDQPFGGLKSVFPSTRSIVCVTDDGGSTGELLKDLQLFAVGDMRRVLLSAVQGTKLEKKYGIDRRQAYRVTKILARIFNWRFYGPLTLDHPEFQEIQADLDKLPSELKEYLRQLFDLLFVDKRLSHTLKRSHCFGNLLLAAAIYKERTNIPGEQEFFSTPENMHLAVEKGINVLAVHLGAGERAVMPCTSTPAQLKVIYTNGVAVRGEHKLADAKREFPVGSVENEYCGEVVVSSAILDDISTADIIILAPGSLYSSIIPVFKVPGLADAVRHNSKALKVLVSNLWVQTGETDLSIVDPDRKYHVSDMIRAYEKNIPGGTTGLFNEVLCISLNEIPASILQNYAVEGKVPIYLDKEAFSTKGFIPIECDVYSESALLERNVIQHDPDTLALAIKGLYGLRESFDKITSQNIISPDLQPRDSLAYTKLPYPCEKYSLFKNIFSRLDLKGGREDSRFDRDELVENIIDILWEHPVIPVDHFDNVAGIHCIDVTEWDRDQQWDNVFSFYDPADNIIKIRADQIHVKKKLEIALMVAIGESLLGDYAEKKMMIDVELNGLVLGKTYFLYLRDKMDRCCYFTQDQLHEFLILSRMCATDNENLYTRLVNKGGSFTPPGLMMGLVYAWYVDNRLATHIEYKMSVLKISRTDLIPAQLEMVKQREDMIRFFRKIVFKV